MKETKQVCVLVVMTVILLNGLTLAELGTPVVIDLPDGIQSMTLDRERNLLYVTNKPLNQIEVISVSDYSVLPSIPVGSQPEGLDISHDGNFLWVVNTGAMNLSKVDLNTGEEVLPRITTPDWASNIVISADGLGIVRTGSYYSGYKMYKFTDGTFGDEIGSGWRECTSEDHSKLVHATRKELHVYDAETGSWKPSVAIPGYGVQWWEWLNALAIGNDGQWAIVSNTPQSSILDDNLTIVGTLSKAYHGIVLDPFNRQAYGIGGTQLDVIDLERALVTETVTLPRQIAANTSYPGTRHWTPLLISSDGSELYELNHDAVTIIPTGLVEEPEEPYVVPKAGNLRGLAYDEFRKRIYISNSTTNQVETYDLNTETWLDPIDVGSLPEGLDVTPEGTQLYVLNTGVPKVSVIDLTLEAPVEVDRITLEGISPVTGWDEGNKWKFAGDGTAFFNMGSQGCQFFPETNTLIPVYTADQNHIYPTWDRNAVALGHRNKAQVYDVLTSELEPEATLQDFGDNWGNWIVAIAMTNDRSIRAATRNGTTVFFDSNWEILGTVPGASSTDDNWNGLVFSPDGSVLYRAVRTGGYQVEKIDANTMTVFESIPLPERLAMRDGGDVKMSKTGDYLYAVSQSGLMIIPTGELPVAFVVITQSSGSTDVDEAGPTSDNYTLVLSIQPTAGVTITVDPDNQTDVGSGPDNLITLTFTPDDWDSPQLVVVTAVDDTLEEDSHTSIISHSAASGDPNFDGINIVDVIVNVTDNDPVESTLSLLAPNGGEKLISGRDYMIEWESAGPIEDVLLLYSLNNGQYWILLDIVQNTGSYQWQLPILNSDQCLVSIWDIDDLDFGDTSNGVFTIFQCAGPIVGDFNQNCYVNWGDFSILASHWLETGCSAPDWCSGADLNHGGEVTWGDFGIFASHWLECGNPLDPSCQTE